MEWERWCQDRDDGIVTLQPVPSASGRGGAWESSRGRSAGSYVDDVLPAWGLCEPQDQWAIHCLASSKHN
jgi:hypothetical protein